jgi:hypothetical protein
MRDATAVLADLLEMYVLQWENRRELVHRIDDKAEWLVRRFGQEELDRRYEMEKAFNPYDQELYEVSRFQPDDTPSKKCLRLLLRVKAVGAPDEVVEEALLQVASVYGNVDNLYRMVEGGLAVDI